MEKSLKKVKKSRRSIAVRWLGQSLGLAVLIIIVAIVIVLTVGSLGLYNKFKKKGS